MMIPAPNWATTAWAVFVSSTVSERRNRQPARMPARTPSPASVTVRTTGGIVTVRISMAETT